MYFLWTKKKRPQLDGDEISVAFTVPRMIRLEYILSQMTLGNSGLTRIQEVIAEAMTSQAGRNEEVGGPFQYAVITQDGIRIIEG